MIDMRHMPKANLIFGGSKIHEKAQEGNEPFEQFVTNFLTACKRLCLKLRVKR